MNWKEFSFSLATIWCNYGNFHNYTGFAIGVFEQRGISANAFFGLGYDDQEKIIEFDILFINFKIPW